MLWSSLQRWRGIILVGLAVVATLIFAISDQLVLYIHPRYVIFTIVMVVIALVLVVASLLHRSNAGEVVDDEPRRGVRALGITAAAVAGLMAVGMVLLPPATLSATTAQQRDLNSTALNASSQTVDAAAGASAAAVASFTVLDWASLLRQTSDLAFYADKPVDVVGFVAASPDDPENVFYVSRFFVTCCAVDAQPAGVPVYAPGWAAQFPEDSWVQVTGLFTTNPSSGSAEPLAIDPEQILPVEQPREPYLF